MNSFREASLQSNYLLEKQTNGPSIEIEYSQKTNLKCKMAKDEHSRQTNSPILINLEDCLNTPSAEIIHLDDKIELQQNDIKRIVIIKNETESKRRGTIISLKGACTLDKHYYLEGGWAWIVCLCAAYVNFLCFFTLLNGVHLLIGQFFLEQRLALIALNNQLLYQLNSLTFSKSFNASNELFSDVQGANLSSIWKLSKNGSYLNENNFQNNLNSAAIFANLAKLPDQVDLFEPKSVRTQVLNTNSSKLNIKYPQFYFTQKLNQINLNEFDQRLASLQNIKLHTVFINSLSSAISLFCSPFVVSFCQYNSPRLVAFLGSIMCSLGLLFTSFATEYIQLLIAYSFMFAFGSCFLRESSIIVLSKYFKHRRILVEMIICFTCYLMFAFLPIFFSYLINIKSWRSGLQIYALFFLTCFFICILMRPASLYHPQRRAILHLKNLQKKTRMKNEQNKTKYNQNLKMPSLACKMYKPFKYVDFSVLRSRTIQLLLCSICLMSFGLFSPNFVLCPTLYIQHKFSLRDIYYMQFTFGLSGLISPILAYLFFNQNFSNQTKCKKLNLDLFGVCLENNHQKNVYNLFNPLRTIQLSAFCLAFLQLISIRYIETNQLTSGLLVLTSLYGLMYSMFFCSFKIYLIRQVRARSICLLWAWFECAQAIPLLIGVILTVFLNDRFGHNIGTYVSFFCCFLASCLLFSVDLYHKLSKKNCIHNNLFSSNQFNTVNLNLNQLKKSFPSSNNQLLNIKNLFDKSNSKSLFGKTNCKTNQIDKKHLKYLYKYGLKQFPCNTHHIPSISEFKCGLKVKSNDALLKQKQFNYNESVFMNSLKRHSIENSSKPSLDTLLSKSKFTNKSISSSKNFSRLTTFLSVPELNSLDQTYIPYSESNNNLNNSINLNKMKKYSINSSLDQIYDMVSNDFENHNFSKSEYNFQSTKNDLKLNLNNSPEDQIDYLINQPTLDDNLVTIKKKTFNLNLNKSSSNQNDFPSLSDVAIKSFKSNSKKQKFCKISNIIDKKSLKENLKKDFSNQSLKIHVENLKEDSILKKIVNKKELYLNNCIKKNLSTMFRSDEKQTSYEMDNLSESDLENNEKCNLDHLTRKKCKKFVGNLICHDYETLIKNLKDVKNNQIHQQGCLASKIVQEIINQVNLKSLLLDSPDCHNHLSSNNKILKIELDLDEIKN